MKEKAWGGRFAEKTNRAVELFTASIDFDKRLYLYDIEGSVAHCRTLARAAIISEEEAAALIEGLGRIKREIERGEFEYDSSLEDIHMHIEARLVQEVGKAARKLHTARSRNDQVVLDARMYLRDVNSTVLQALAELRKAFLDLAQKHINLIVPGYTHMQRAQPVLMSHHLMAYYEMFTRDAERFQDAMKRINVMPLGSAALAGTTYPIDREYTAELLHFPKVSANSIDAVSDRDFMLEFLAAASICMTHLSRLSEELIMWSTTEFDFVEMPDAFSTGSSIMPQKKNPDVAELVRGKTGRVFGSLTALLTLMKGLPLAYNRDMQEDKAPLFDTADTLLSCLDVYTQMLPRLKFNTQRLYEAAVTGFLNATDLADYLTNKGLPFREAHHCVGAAVSYAIEHGKELHELTLAELKKFSPLITEEVYEVLSVEQMINRRLSYGGTATENVLAAIAAAQQRLEEEAAEVEEK